MEVERVPCGPQPLHIRSICTLSNIDTIPSFFFFFVSTRMKGEAETRASCRCFRLVSGCSILKKFLKRLLAELRADFFLPTFQSPWFLTPIRIVFRGISRGCVWFYPIGSDSSIIDEFIPSPSLSRRRWYTHSREIDGESK